MLLTSFVIFAAEYQQVAVRDFILRPTEFSNPFLRPVCDEHVRNSTSCVAQKVWLNISPPTNGPADNARPSLLGEGDQFMRHRISVSRYDRCYIASHPTAPEISIPSRTFPLAPRIIGHTPQDPLLPRQS